MTLHVAPLVQTALLAAAFGVCVDAAAPRALPAIPWLAGTTRSLLTRDRESTWFTASGYSAVRRLVRWNETEVARGVFDWTALDLLVPAAYNSYISTWLVLTGGNDHYDGGAAPTSPAAVAAFAAWARAVTARYAASLSVVEVWDRPNTAASWPPAPDAGAYAALCAAAGSAIKAAQPAVTLLGLSTAPRADGAGLDAAFVSAALAAGALAPAGLWDGASPYLGRWDAATGVVAPPEELAADIRALRALLAGRAPIYAAVYSYASQPTRRAGAPAVAAAAGALTPAALDELTQGEYLGRAWMSGLVAGVNVSVWAAWRDGELCDDAGNDGACTLGAVRRGYQNASVPYVTKPAFYAGGAPNRGGSPCALAGSYAAPTTGSDGSNATCYAIYTDCGFLTPGFNAWCDSPPGWSANFTFPFNPPGAQLVGTSGVCYWPLNFEGMQAGGLVCSGGEPLSWTLAGLGDSLVYLVSHIWQSDVVHTG